MPEQAEANRAGPFIENRAFEELHVGDTAKLTRVLRSQDIATSPPSGGAMPVTSVQALWGASVLSELLSTDLPEPARPIWSSHCTSRPLRPSATWRPPTSGFADLIPETRQVTLSCECRAASGEILMDGLARVIAPGSKLRWPRALKADAALPAAGTHFRRLLDAARQFDPIRTAVVHPCDTVSLVSAMEAMEAGSSCRSWWGPWRRSARWPRRPGEHSRASRSSMCP